MKILLTIPNAGYSGAEHQLLSLAIGLQRNGHDIALCNLDGKGLFTEKATLAGIYVDVIQRRSRLDFRRLLKYRKLLAYGQFDVVISFTYSANNLTRIAKFLLPFTNFAHIAGERGRIFQGQWFPNILDSILAVLTTKIVFNSGVQKKKYLHHEWVRREKTSVINNGFNFEENFAISPINLNTEFGISKGTRVVFGVGNLSSHKNIEMYIRVMEEVTNKIADVVFIYIGSGPDLDHYRTVVQEKGLENRCMFIGRREDVMALLKAGHIFVLTSWWEGMPNVIIEAIAAGLPVVSTAIDGVNEIIDNGRTGFLVRPDDHEVMATRILRLLSDEQLYTTVSSSSLADIKPIFNMNEMVSAYENLIREIAK